MKTRAERAAGYTGVVVGALANLTVLGVNLPLLLPLSDRPWHLAWSSRFSIWLGAQLLTLYIGLPLSAWALRAGQRSLGKLGEALSTFPLLLGGSTAMLFPVLEAALAQLLGR